ncbi:hypothetical protein K461DRAFT_302364 [Myriangium duriaei CBS 260.36]|uniref:Uncharacterized protein n=1 Tax=Myriangium duriaei CBS 260.36 TaxID=1168546 RepID=A0A9P4IQ18_9PEZI|nr:hypothetical protein K461DRAFT_302364 [Myriangium duriaei CBS 260.36]
MASPPPAQAASTIVVPMTVHAFVVSEDFPQSELQMAPVTMPDFSLLQPEAGQITHDIMEQLDVSYWSTQAPYNSRFVDLTTGNIRRDRVGVYLSWCLPRLYRSSITSTTSAAQAQDHRSRAGFRPSLETATNKVETERAQFRPAPDRWIIVRRSRSGDGSDRCVMLESNCVRNIDDDELGAAVAPDLNNITAPAVNSTLSIDQQYKSYLGRSADFGSASASSTTARTYQTPFTAFESSNEFFADYQPQNMGVFSFFDDLHGCSDAVVDYAVVGYHYNSTDDPLVYTRAQPVGSTSYTNGNLLDALSLDLDAKVCDTFLQKAADNTSRTLSHGIIRNVQFNRSVSSLSATSITLQQTVLREQPVAVGAHSLDALAALLRATVDPASSANAVNQLIGQLLMLIAGQDNVMSQQQAAEKISTADWITQSKGKVWQFPKTVLSDKSGSDDTKRDLDVPGSTNFVPTSTQKNALYILNNFQSRLDACLREQLQVGQTLFECWWNAVGLQGVDSEVLPDRRYMIKAVTASAFQRYAALEADIASLVGSVASATQSVADTLEKVQPSCSAGDAYGIHQDPTVLFAGISSGWPPNFSDNLPVRLAAEIAPEVDPSKPVRQRVCNEQALKEALPDIAIPLCETLREVAELDPHKRDWVQSPYDDLQDMKGCQSWFPLYLEWEVEYYHIPYDKWQLQIDVPTGSWNYIVSDTLDQNPADGVVDSRTLSGRVAITPQAETMLKTRLAQLFSQTHDSDITFDPSALLESIGFDFFATPLAGFTDHILTRRRGHHPCPYDDSNKTISTNMGLTTDDLANAKVWNRNLAPYGATTPLPSTYTSFTPFKPVTHGQCRFIKLLVVDKFGQIVSGVRPGEPGDQDSGVYPCISPSFQCGVIPGRSADYLPNTAVKADEDANICQFFQIPPRINQAARLNAHFVLPRMADADLPVVAGPWDNPIWGWVLVNYQNHSIQMFNPDGSFTAEIVIQDMKHKTKVVATPGVTMQTAQGRLSELLTQLNNYEFASNMFGMLASAVDHMATTTGDFDSMIPSVLGRPFCFADIGMSIELAAPPLADASLLTAPPQIRRDDTGLLQYEFPVVLGNHSASFDGLIGTFAGSGIDTTLLTGYTLKKGMGTGLSAGLKDDWAPAPIPLTPYFIQGDSVDDLTAAHAANLVCTSAVLDPRSAVHIYSGSLFPVVDLVLPGWTVELAMRSMHTFFRTGPLLVPQKPAKPTVGIQDTPTTATTSVQLPLGIPGTTWQWLQPSVDRAGTEWQSVSIRPVDTHLKVDEADEAELVSGIVYVSVDSTT